MDEEKMFDDSNKKKTDSLDNSPKFLEALIDEVVININDSDFIDKKEEQALFKILSDLKSNPKSHKELLSKLNQDNIEEKANKLFIYLLEKIKTDDFYSASKTLNESGWDKAYIKVMFNPNDAKKRKKIRELNSLREQTKKDSQATNSKNLPVPKKIAELYHIEKGSKHKEYSADQIAPVMEITKNYIEENLNLQTILGHIKPIRKKSSHLEGGKDAKSNWIKFYAEKAGLKPK